MKIKSLSLPFVITLLVGCLTARAQNATLSKTDTVAHSLATQKPQNFYFELLGPGALYSVNYDTRFKNRQDGLGWRAGVSYYAQDGDQLLTVPLMFNYLLGKKGKYFEIGAGLTFYHTNTSDVFFDQQQKYDATYNYYYYEPEKRNGVYGTLSFGYRYQPLDGGFSFRAGVSPIINSNNFIPYWPYVSFGYTF
ncbi:hypothetical protein A0256_21770 [Mucilaginibacter sp. PAMC 26640]|nr:hypothetical protein A0256_21770 [Mucilaginibacter sp. PAMC 26640]